MRPNFILIKLKTFYIVKEVNVKKIIMKLLKNTFLLLMLLLVGPSLYAAESDSLGEIGDNLDLHAVLDAFKNSESVE